ncbi:MAG: hypothetical protein ACR2QJ_11265 [Geminicoccaceae bacterium]
MNSSARRALLASLIVGVSLGIGGCRDDEQGRPMAKQKGVYEGPADDGLAEDKLQELRSRAAGQKF